MNFHQNDSHTEISDKEFWEWKEKYFSILVCHGLLCSHFFLYVFLLRLFCAFYQVVVFILYWQSCFDCFYVKIPLLLHIFFVVLSLSSVFLLRALDFVEEATVVSVEMGFIFPTFPLQSSTSMGLCSRRSMRINSWFVSIIFHKYF